MRSGDAVRGGSLERWSARLFVIAAVLFVGHTGVRALGAFTSVAPPVDVFGPTGYVLAMLGIAGLTSPRLGQSTIARRLAVGVPIALAASWGAVAVGSYGEALGIGGVATGVPGWVVGPVILTTLLTYLVLGLGGRRGGWLPTTVAGLLLAPAGALVLLVVAAMVLSLPSQAGGALIGAVMAVSHGGLGWHLATASPTATTAASHGSTVE